MKNIYVAFLFSLIILTGCEIPGIPREEPSPIVSLYVGPEMVECENPLSNNLCFQIKNSLEEGWQLYKGTIMGLQYEPGFIYELQAQLDSLSKSSPNSPDQQWVLIKIVQKVPMNNETNSIRSDLVGVMWTMTQFGAPATLMTAIGEPAPNLFLHPDGHFTGNTGCNRFNGSFEVKNDEMQFSGIAVTKMMCAGEPGKLEQEQTILKTMAAPGKFQLKEGVLTIFSLDGNQLLIYEQ